MRLIRKNPRIISQIPSSYWPIKILNPKKFSNKIITNKMENTQNSIFVNKAGFSYFSPSGKPDPSQQPPS